MQLFPTDLASFLTIIRENGELAYSLMFAWASSHSLLLALFGGYAAHAGALNFGALIGVCWAGSFFGDVFRFWIGRYFGIGWLKRWPRIHGGVMKAAVLSERYSILMILLHRYPHGIRGIAAFAYGVSKLPWPVFMIVNLVAAGIWAVAIVSAGYAFGHVSEKVLSDASSTLGVIMLAIFLALSWWLSKKFDLAAAQAAQPQTNASKYAPGSEEARRERRLRKREGG
ncbi:MAG: hypothetical protein FJX29_10130 [Alphaproteobacteria bacterium]|nr:hypothetical protein [Alphaproteobacteria bacterium]